MAGKKVDQAAYRTSADSEFPGSPVFKSPSGKIICGIISNQYQQQIRGLICSVFATAPLEGHFPLEDAPAAFPSLPITAECQKRNTPWGPSSVEMSESSIERGLCPSQIVVPYKRPVLAYGSTVDFDGFACRIESDGLTCVTPSGKGFFMSSSAYREFG